jgi:hypothetical protein
MQLSSIWIIVALVVSMISPITAHVTISSHNQEQRIVSLDVCSASGSFISANDNSPSLHECCCTQVPFEFTECIKTNNLSYSPSLFSIQLERPPRA